MKDDLLYITHILECIARIEKYTLAGREAFFSDSMVTDAVVRNFQTLAESAKRISPEIRDSSREIDWRALAAFRNVLVHDYLGLDLARIWDIVALDLPALKQRIEALRERLSPPRSP